MKSSGQVKAHSATFHYKNKRITFHFWTHLNPGSAVDTVLFMGSAQVGRIPKWVAQAAPAGTVVVDGMPHWHPRPTAEDLGRFTREYSVAAFKAVLEYFQLPSAHIVGLSQATIGLVWLAQTLPGMIRNIGVVAPLGLTAAELGPTDAARLNELKKRTLRTYLQFSQTPFYGGPRVVYAQLTLLRAMMREAEKGATNTKYALGLSYNLLEDCRHVAAERHKRGFTFTVFFAEKDKIFPPHEILSALTRAGIAHVRTVLLPGISHPSLATWGNKKALAQIINDIRQS